MAKKIIFVFIVIGLCFPLLSVANEADVNNVKVAYIYNFIKYTTWPNQESENKPFDICVHEDSPLRDKLVVLEKKSYRKEPIKLTLISDSTKEISKCSVLVIPKLKPDILQNYVKQADKSNVLTISDTPGYASQGVMINLVLINNRVKFEINLDAVDSSDLKISSSLLKLAKIIRDQR
jgi:hypothetical protein